MLALIVLAAVTAALTFGALSFLAR